MPKYMLCIVFIVSILLTGCNRNETINELQSQIILLEEEIEMLQNKIAISDDTDIQINTDESFHTETKVKIAGVRDNTLLYMLAEDNDISQVVHIIGSDVDEVVEEYNEISIDGLGEGEIFRAEVIGTIYDFQLVELKWDESLVEGKVLKQLDKVTNTSIIINTTLPCGMPMEKMKWKDQYGKEHEIFLEYDGYGFDGKIVWIK